MELLKIQQVSKQYENADYDAVQPCDLTIHRGECISIQGVSGSGKSTLLLMMSGLLQPSSGQVLWNGKNIYSMSDRELSAWRGKTAGYLFQNVQLIQALTIRENMLMARQFGNDPKKDVDAIIQALGLEREANSLPGRLSGGQRRRAMIGCVLARDPQIIFADEPTNDLDAVWAQKIMDHLLGLIKEGRALVLVTHDARWLPPQSSSYRMDDGVLSENK